MPMSQDRINTNLLGAISVINKAIINIIARQQLDYARKQDTKMVDLTEIDRKILEQLQDQIDRMKAII